MPALDRYIPPVPQEFDTNAANGIAAGSGWKLYFYASGTTTPKDTYSDAARTTPNANPVVAGSAGRFGAIFMGTGSYRVILKDDDDVTIWTRDDVAGGYATEVSNALASSTVTAFSGAIGAYALVANYDDGQQAAELAYAAGVPLYVKDGETAYLTCDPSNGDDLQAMANWLTSCKEVDDPDVFLEGGKLWIQLADGTHTLNNFIDVSGPIDHTLDIRASAEPDILAITAIAYAAVSGTTYEATITTSTALPEGYAVGDPIGIRCPVGDEDAASAAGGQIVKSIAGDRLSFTFDFFSPNGAPTSPTTLTSGTTPYGLTNNQVICPKARLIVQSTGWGTGLQREGWLNLFSGATTDFRDFGIAYSGSPGTDHDLIFAESTGSRAYGRQNMVLAGAGDFVLRAFQGAEHRWNTACIGGAALADNLVTGVAGSNYSFVRCSFGGAASDGISAGSSTQVQSSSCIIASCLDGLQTNGGNISWRDSRVSNCVNGIRQTAGTVELDALDGTIIERCAVGIRRSQTDGAVIGGTLPTFTDNTVDSTITATFGIGLDYVPTLTNGANVASSTASDIRWEHNRATTEVWGKVSITPTAAAGTKTVFNMSLPQALTQAFGSDLDLIGSGVVHDLAAAKGTNVSIKADTANDEATFTFFADSMSAHEIVFRFTYIRF